MNPPTVIVNHARKMNQGLAAVETGNRQATSRVLDTPFLNTRYVRIHVTFVAKGPSHKVPSPNKTRDVRSGLSELLASSGAALIA